MIIELDRVIPNWKKTEVVKTALESSPEVASATAIAQHASATNMAVQEASRQPTDQKDRLKT